MKSTELPKVLKRATTLLVPMGSYYGELEAYTISEGLVLVTKKDRFCASIAVQNRVGSLYLALDMTEMSLSGDADRNFSWTSPVKRPWILRRIYAPQRSSFLRSFVGYDRLPCTDLRWYVLVPCFEW